MTRKRDYLGDYLDSSASASRDANPPRDATAPRFWEKPLADLDAAEWEALCDGCGQCCLHKLEDIDNGDIYVTDVACRLLDISTARCRDYTHRRRHVPDCVSLSLESLAKAVWLPESCSYRLRAQGKPLPDWHYLLCGDHTAVHRAYCGDSKISIVGRVVSESADIAVEKHIVGSIQRWQAKDISTS